METLLPVMAKVLLRTIFCAVFSADISASQKYYWKFLQNKFLQSLQIWPDFDLQKTPTWQMGFLACEFAELSLILQISAIPYS